MDQSSPFKSFWMGGFESANHIGNDGKRVDMIATTQHHLYAEEDYGNLAKLNIRTTRDAVRWPLVDLRNSFYLNSLEKQMRALKRHDMQVVWSLSHFGWPADIDILSPRFIYRFTSYAKTIAQFVKDNYEDIPIYLPFVSPSYVAWALGDAKVFYSNSGATSSKLKRQLAQAIIAATEAIWDVDERARIVHSDALINVAPNPAIPGSEVEASRQTEAQYEVWDMISGALAPELGGNLKYLDIMGVNYHSDSQWQYQGDLVSWKTPALGWKPLNELLDRLHKRYGRPIVISETGGKGDQRAEWLQYVTAEVALAISKGTPIEGVCLYPVIGTPASDKLDVDKAGLWDVKLAANGTLTRVLNREYARTLETAQAFIETLRSNNNIASYPKAELQLGRWQTLLQPHLAVK